MLGLLECWSLWFCALSEVVVLELLKREYHVEGFLLSSNSSVCGFNGLYGIVGAIRLIVRRG